MVKLGGNPSRKRMALLVLSGVATLIVAVFLLVYFVIFPTSSPKPFKLASTPTNPADTTSSATASTGGESGRWIVASGSQAGYRVREKLAFLPAQSDAVGRTSSITGAAQLSESGRTITITSASFNVAVNTLTSDRSMRDEKIHEIGLESNRYPTATFVMLSPRQPRQERGRRPRHAGARDRGLHDPWHLQEQNPPRRIHPVGLNPRGRRLAHLPVERIRHERTKHRRLRQRDRTRDDGIRPAPAAGLSGAMVRAPLGVLG